MLVFVLEEEVKKEEEEKKKKKKKKKKRRRRRSGGGGGKSFVFFFAITVDLSDHKKSNVKFKICCTSPVLCEAIVSRLQMGSLNNRGSIPGGMEIFLLVTRPDLGALCPVASDSCVCQAAVFELLIVWHHCE
jgi:hypothetical protein